MKGVGGKLGSQFSRFAGEEGDYDRRLCGWAPRIPKFTPRKGGIRMCVCMIFPQFTLGSRGIRLDGCDHPNDTGEF